MPNPVHALTAGMTGQCDSRESLRIFHYRVIMFYITFPFMSALLDIDVQLVFPPTLEVMGRKREALPFSALWPGQVIGPLYPPSTSGKGAQEAFLPQWDEGCM